MFEPLCRLPGSQIDHLGGVVAERRHEQALAIDIDVEMIDATPHITQRNGLHKPERRSRLRDCRAAVWHDRHDNPEEQAATPSGANPRHRCKIGNATRPTIAASATINGSGSFLSFQMSTTVAMAIAEVVMSMIDRFASTITAPMIAPMAAAVTPSTNATSAGRFPYFLK